VISSLPLGVLKAKIVDFQPSLPDKYLKIIDKLGIGNMNKLYVSFTNRFWNYKSGWLNFVTKNANTNKFPIATVIPS
jgi:monoamine oxidase